ncbi:hypothetical protein HFN80_17000 [Rhizobium laguerreae]|uniref:hypothetical protein n=1 Tax=Rhizobium laguerreae TaxID=1076926 RepID=UPI001C9278C8|nr:hypothetical protein [Rhizobium laguerreae]MBY3465691.1 hypothetical protein [Rhizobium laguerreae]
MWDAKSSAFGDLAWFKLAEPDTAVAYAEHCEQLWCTTPHAVAYLHWLHPYPKVMRERSEIFAMKEALALGA